MTRRAWVAGVVVMVGLLAISSAARVGRGGSPDGSGAPGAAASPSPPTKVDINTATAAELERLPGMAGPLSRLIIANRPYRKIDDLVRRNVLGRKQLAAIKEHITVGEAGGGPHQVPDR